MPAFGDLLADGSGWLYLPFAFLLGAVHALEPGHAKSMMAGFIVATRGTAAQAVLLGLSAAVAHSLVVWALVLLGLWLGTAVPDHWLPWLGIAAGVLALGVAAWIGAGLWRRRRAAGGADHADHEHGHHHHHHHHHHAAAGPGMAGDRPVGASTAQVVAFGFSGGLMPCPAALAVLALCLSVGAVGLGLATVAAFSAGLAVVLVGVGVIAAASLQLASFRFPALSGAFSALPWISVAVIAASGLWTLLHAAARLNGA
jgi:nickel/cobalt exporter